MNAKEQFEFRRAEQTAELQRRWDDFERELIADAATARDQFELDELERYADNFRQKLEIQSRNERAEW